MKIQIFSRFSGSLLFEHTQDGNSINATIAAAAMARANLCGACLYSADLRGAYLRGANLGGADLSRARLCGAYLHGADLRGAYLRGADLDGACLSDADLNGANLSDADLSGADLDGADLSDAYGSTARTSSLQYGKYTLIALDADIVWGSCTKKTAQEWLDYAGQELNDYDRNYLETVTKPFVRMVMAAKNNNQV